DNHSASPIDINKASFLVAGQKIHPSDWYSEFIHSVRQDTILFNFTWLLREQLNKAKNGDTIPFAIEGIRDGAGNATPRLDMSYKINHSLDKTGPSWHHFELPKSVPLWIGWDGQEFGQFHLSFGHDHHARLSSGNSATGYIELVCPNWGSSWCERGITWKPAEHPYIACRLRMNPLRPSTKVYLRFRIKGRKGQDYQISLVKPEQQPHDLNKTQTFPWVNNQWRTFLFNVRDLLKQSGVNDKQLADMVIDRIAFQREKAQNNDLLFLDDLVVFGAPKNQDTPDLLTWFAFDASGIASLKATALDDNAKPAWSETFQGAAPVNLNRLRARVKGAQWFQLQAFDKAGNPSEPVWFPIAGF
ncbi:MAG: hypothetical protein IJJ26_01670, partial [Victivallales bacterium]|nr:hypothetical protein [Victivallales bacterium]